MQQPQEKTVFKGKALRMLYSSLAKIKHDTNKFVNLSYIYYETF